MKKLLFIGLITLTSTSVFANCDVGSIECHIGKYTGKDPGTYSNKEIGYCDLEISKSGNKKNDIVVKYTYIQGYGNPFTGTEWHKPVTITGKVASSTQKYELYDKAQKTSHLYISRDTISYLTLKTKRPEGSNRTLNFLNLQFNDQEQLIGSSHQIRTYQPIYSAAFSNLDEIFGGSGIDKFDYEYKSCGNLVKIN